MKRSKIRISLSIFLSLVMLFNTISPALAALQALPPAVAPYNNMRDKFDTDLFTGSANYSHPIEVPKGTNGLTPNVSLSYNSSAARDASAYLGIGWDLNKDYIERDANYTPGSTSDDKFKLRFQGVVYDLVYVSSEGRYHTKIESNLYISKLTSGEENDYNEYWQVITPDGTKYRFGQSTNSELVCNGRSYVYRWNLDLVTDVHSNNIYYTYSESSGASYLTKIEYNTEKSRVIEFTYGSHPYQKQVYVQGCNIIETSRLSNIKINTVGSGFDETGLQAYYKLENTSDSKGANTLTNNNSINFATGKFTNGADGGSSNNNKYLSRNSNLGIAGNGDLSVSLWVKLNSEISSGIQDIWELNSTSGADRYAFAYYDYNGGTRRIIFDAAGGTSAVYNIALGTSGYHHLVFTRNISGNQSKLYVDGVLQSTGTVGTGATYQAQNSFGLLASAIGVNPMSAKMDDVGVFSRVLTATEVSTLYNSGSELASNLPASPLVRQYDLNYGTAGNNQSVLQSIIERGSDASSVLPPVVFDYKSEIKSWSTSPNTGVKWIDHADIDAPLNSTSTTLMDVNGDGLPDIIKTSQVQGGSAWKVLVNQGSSWSTTWSTWASPVSDDPRLDRADTRLMDVTGDNLPDIVKSEAGSSGGLSYWHVWKNTGSSWNTTKETWVNNGFVDAYFAQTDMNLIDVNGDGLSDVVKTSHDNNSSWFVYKNTGTTWNSSKETWLVASINAHLEDPNVRLMDVNGDGLPDIVKTTHSGSNATWTVYKNTGSGWSSTGETWINNAGVDAYFEKTNVVVVDVNGDGLPDIIKSDDLGSADRWNVLLNKGNSWSTTYEVWIDPSANVDVDAQNDNVRLADVNGDGLTDIVRGQMDCSCGYNTYYVWKNNGVSPDLLASVRNREGGIISFDYKPSTIYDNTGPDTISDLPFPLWVVEKMTLNNGMTNAHQTNDITTYSYKDGLYDWEDKEFRGFSEVNTTEPNGSKKKYVFKQDDATKGRLDEMQHRNSSSDPFAETDNIWSSSTSNGVTTVKLDTEKFITYDATTSGAKTIQNDYTYDSYGNVTKKSELGDTSTSSDNRYIYNEYTYNTTAWIVNTAKHTYLNKSDDSTKVSESLFYYDGNTSVDTAPTKGDLTKEEKWLTGGNKLTQYAYDTYGNQTSVTDANNHTTSIAYDTATKTYPISTTNAKNQTTTMSYDLGTGNLLSKTDPNGLTTSYEYDVFGRIFKEIKPYDSSSNSTTKYSYIFDGIAPEGVLISKRETSSSSATLDTYTFNDGLGRKVQTRIDAEDSTKQRIVDTFYDPTGEVKKETVPYFASSSAVAPTSVPPSKFGDGSDGNITISSNTTEAPIDSSVSALAGGSTVTVGSGLGFAANQIVMLHQTQGTNAGAWEFARVYAYNGTNLTLTGPLANSYSNSGSNKAQVRVVPQYQNVTVNSGVTWTAKAWNGTTGGIIAFLANGTVTVSGTISANGKGFVGGTVTAFVDGHQGEGTAGPAGALSSGANSNGGGGNISPKGAGGGGNGTAGTTVSGGGTGGSVVGNDDLTVMVYGGGGGSGDDVSSGSGGNNYGGNGGGNIFINGANIFITGSMTANGNNGGVPNGGTHGGGGGGAGGSILLKSQTATLSASLVTASAGNGGNGTGSGTAGGNGGVGRIRVEYENSLSGTTNPSASSAQVTIPYLPSSTPAYGSYADPDSLAKYTQWSYDAIGRPSIITNPKGDSKTISYDHWKETTIDENGHIKREYKNAFDKIWKVEEVNGANTYTTTYEYDSRDLLTKITDHLGNISTFVYDSLGRKTSQVDPDMGTWTYTYDGLDNVLTQTDNRNVTTTKTYDELDRVTRIDYPNDTDNTFAYDLGKIGTLSIATDSAGTVTYSYDNRLRKTQESRTIDGNTWTTQFSYDAMDRLKSKTYPDGEVVTNIFNNQGEIESASGSASLLTNIDYNALGKIIKKDFANGLTTNYTYNTDDFRLIRILTGSLQDLGYTYDKVGNVKTRTNNLTSKTETFGYDDLDRLTVASESGGFNHEYQYNAIGNLTSFISSGSATNYTYGSGSAIPHALTSSTETPQSCGTEILGTTWNMATTNGSDEDDKTIPSNSLNGMVSAQVTFNLHGYTFGGGDDEASIVFIQNSDWRAANVTFFGAQNGYNGSQTVTIPLTSFHKVGNSSITLDPSQAVSNIHARFWGSGTFSVDVTSVKLIPSSCSSPTATPTPTPTATPTPTPASGFSAEYFNNKTLTGSPTLTRTDTTVNFDWGSGSPHASINADNFSARWTKTETFSAGTHQFTVTADDGVKLYIDNTVVIDKWIDQGPTTYTTSQTLSSGSHTIKMEYYDSGGGAVAQLSYQQGNYMSGGVYRLVNQCGNKVLNVASASTANGGNVDQYTWNNGGNQKWKIETASSGYYKLTAQHSSKVLDVSGAGTSDGTNVQQWSWSNVSNQEWSITDVGSGYYKLLAKHSSKALDVSGASSSDGANVQQWTDNGSCAQKWKIETF